MHNTPPIDTPSNDTPSIKEQIEQGMQQQLAQWREALQQGATRLGWKVGMNRKCDQEAAGVPTPQIGYLLKERSALQSGSHPDTGGKMVVEGEIAIQLKETVPAGATPEQAEAAIAGYSSAIELVDITLNRGDNITSLLTCNLVHKMVLLGEQLLPHLDLNDLTATMSIDNKQVGELDPSRVPDRFGPLLCQIAAILDDHGEQLQAGDWIITGAATTPVAVESGNRICFKLADLDEIDLNIT